MAPGLRGRLLPAGPCRSFPPQRPQGGPSSSPPPLPRDWGCAGRRAGLAFVQQEDWFLKWGVGGKACMRPGSSTHGSGVAPLKLTHTWGSLESHSHALVSQGDSCKRPGCCFRHTGGSPVPVGDPGTGCQASEAITAWKSVDVTTVMVSPRCISWIQSHSWKQP